MAATLRELRGRIRSAGSIKKITKAQELIATSRLPKAQNRLESARPYAFEITRMLTTPAGESRPGPSAARRACGTDTGRCAGGVLRPRSVWRVQLRHLPSVRTAVRPAAR